MAYDVKFDDNYGFKNDTRGEYAAEVQVPGLGSHKSDPQVAQDVGEASFALLTPRETSAGLRAPEVPNPYLGQRNASYTLSYDYQVLQASDMFPDNLGGWSPHTDIPHDVAPPAECIEA